MTTPERKVELLAPAGSVAALKAACLAGADAVYLSGKRFGARAFASNFDEHSLRWARRVTASFNVKMFITLNTIVFEDEWPILSETLDFYETLGPDALIIQDIGVARELAQRKSTIPLHLSTQAAWFGIDAEQELKELNISRVILPRELSEAEIAEVIKRFANLEIEVFAHGAMCYSISGRCFWSIALGTRSGNRGTCAQPCRREYSPEGSDNNENHCFSPKDLRLIKHISALQKIGVTAIKLEGRMKSPEYVYQVVGAYRDALDGKKPDTRILDEVYSRSAGRGFLSGPQASSEWQTLNSPDREGVLVGKASGDSREGLTGIFVQTEIESGQGVFWYENEQKRGARLTWIKKDRKQKNLVWVRGISGSIKKGTEIRRSSTTQQSQWEKEWNKDWERRPIDLFWAGHQGSPLAVEAKINGHPIRIESEEPLEFALNKGLEAGPLQKKFAVLGESFKAGRHVTTLLGDGLHISASALKKLKRYLVESLLKFELLPPPRKSGNGILAIVPAKPPENNWLALLSETMHEPEIYIKVWNQTFPFVRDIGPHAWVLPWKSEKSQGSDNSKILHSRIAFWLPPVLNNEHFERLLSELKQTEAREFFCQGWEIFALQRSFPDYKFHLDWSFNICNYASLAYLAQKDIKAVFAREWKTVDLPENLKGFRCLPAWNPLISFSRFKNAIEPRQIVQNSHKDRFFSLPLGNGVTGLFLKDKPAAITYKKANSLLLDVAIDPKENPVQAAKDLNRLIESYKSNYSRN